MGSTLPIPKGTGVLHLTPMASQVVLTVKDLCAKSTLKILGTVEQTFPSREMGGTHPGTLETDALVAVQNTMKGASDQKEVLVSQAGGATAQYKIRPAQYSLLQNGTKQYVLFLTDDNRPIASPVAGVKRYVVTGVWSGLFEFKNGLMFVDADEPDALRKQFTGLTLARVIQQVTSALAGK